MLFEFDSSGCRERNLVGGAPTEARELQPAVRRGAEPVWRRGLSVEQQEQHQPDQTATQPGTYKYKTDYKVPITL